MSTRSQMIHRMNVTRKSLGRTALGEDAPVADIRIHEMLPCRFWDQEARLVVTEGKIVKVAQQRAIAPYGTDVKSNDIITEIYDRRGNRLFEETRYRVDSVHAFPKQCIVLALENAS